MKQYKDELLASCLTFVLSLHHNIVALDIKAYCPALEVGFFFFFFFLLHDIFLMIYFCAKTLMYTNVPLQIVERL